MLSSKRAFFAALAICVSRLPALRRSTRAV